MAEKIKLVQGDTKPPLVCTLTDETTGQPINLTAATPRLKFRAMGASTLRETVAGVVTDGINGVCVFHWTSTTLAGDPGPYEGEIEITYQDGTVQTVYDRLRFVLRQEF